MKVGQQQGQSCCDSRRIYSTSVTGAQQCLHPVPYLPSISKRSAKGWPGLCIIGPPILRAMGAVKLNVMVAGSSASKTTSNRLLSQLYSTAAPPSPAWFQLRKNMPTVLALPWLKTTCSRQQPHAVQHVMTTARVKLTTGPLKC